MRTPQINDSTEEERRRYVKDIYSCIADCDKRGLFTVFQEKILGLRF